MATTPQATAESLTDCQRFFNTDELLLDILSRADALTLVNCQCVCRHWNSIIKNSQKFQETMFLVPVQQSIHTNGLDEVTLNPILKAFFDPLLVCHDSFPLRSSSGKEAFVTKFCTYSDLLTLPWARDGTDENAHARRAFSRREASWHRMLISQPPIRHINWFHEWKKCRIPAIDSVRWRQSSLIRPR